MSIASAKRRGSETQTEVARYLKANGWPYAEPVGAGRPGNDILGAPGLAIEVKARRDFNPQAWLRQAAIGAGLPMVIHRPQGSGLTSVAEWPVTMHLADLVAILRAAGFGDLR